VTYPDEDTPEAHDPLTDRLDAIDRGLRSFHQRSAHREAVIDRLHEENQLLRTGLGRTVLQPVLADLARLYDGLAQQAGRLAETPERAAEQALWASFADDVAMALERYGTDIITAKPGDAYERGRHVAAGFVDNPDPAARDTVAQVLAVGLVDQESGQIRRPVRVRIFREPVVESLSAESVE
jgi:hypothetical protein